MSKLSQIFLTVFAFGLICVVSVLVLRTINPGDAIAPFVDLPDAELPEGMQDKFNKEVSVNIASYHQAQLAMLVEQQKILQKIDENVSRLVGTTAPATIAPAVPKVVEDKNVTEVEIVSPLPTTTYRGIFRRGGIIRSSVGTPGK